MTVLSVIVSYIDKFLLSYKVSSNVSNKINFAKAGAKITKSMKSTLLGILNLAPDWIVLSDLKTKLVVPPFLATHV